MADIKPRTIPEALGLSDRKYKAIYETVEETVKDMQPIEGLMSLKTSFPDVDELIFAVYAFSVKVGYKKANAANEEEGQKGFVAGQIVTISQIPRLLAELEQRGIITVNIREGLNNIRAANVSDIPDEILYGVPREEAEMQQRSEQRSAKADEPQKKPVKKTPDTDEDNHMFG